MRIKVRSLGILFRTVFLPRIISRPTEQQRLTLVVLYVILSLNISVAVTVGIEAFFVHPQPLFLLQFSPGAHLLRLCVLFIQVDRLKISN